MIYNTQKDKNNSKSFMFDFAIFDWIPVALVWGYASALGFYMWKYQDATNRFNWSHALYLEKIQQHNFCTCQTLNTRTCNTWKQITKYKKDMEKYADDIVRARNTLNKLTLRIFV